LTVQKTNKWITKALLQWAKSRCDSFAQNYLIKKNLTLIIVQKRVGWVHFWIRMK